MTDSFLTLLHPRRGHFRLESGHHSDLWLDLEALCLHPGLVQPLAAQLADRLRPYAIDTICGPLNEGAFVSLITASILECEFTYAERFESGSNDRLFPVEYRLPRSLHAVVGGKRVAIVNDVTSAGSAVRGTYADLRSHGAHVVVIGSLLVLGGAIREFAREQAVALEVLEERQYHLWAPGDCPLCAEGVALDPGGTS